MATFNPLDKFIEAMKRRVQDLEIALEDDKDYHDAIAAALEKYSVDKPPPTGVLHTLTTSATTIYETDFYAVVKLASAELLRELAVKFTHTNEGAFLNASEANYITVGDKFESRARKYIEEYKEHVGKSRAAQGSSYVSQASGAPASEITARLNPDHGRKDRFTVPGEGVRYEE